VSDCLIIEAAAPTDLAAVLDLLDRSALPTAGVAEHFSHAFVARVGGRVVGSAALEIYAEGALLRSVAVDADSRDTGVGQRLTAAALSDAERRNLPAVFLLTTTAERFFPRFGFAVITRADVPSSLLQSVEFRSACPDSAVVMRKQLRPLTGSNQPAR
jgi:amino-acid N-acetyltransferase